MMAFAAKNPDELYGDEWFRDLPPEIQTAYTVLGWNETLWDDGISPQSDKLVWNELSPEMQDAASFIGYTQEICDADVEVSVGSNTTTQNDSSGTENITYDDYDWAELPPEIQAAASFLGYDQFIWDNDGAVWSSELYWEDLSPEAQKAATIMGYHQASWDSDGDLELETLLVAAGGQYISNDDDYIFEVGSSDVSEYQVNIF